MNEKLSNLNDPALAFVCSRELDHVPAASLDAEKLFQQARAMEKAGLKANFIQGQRVTDEATVKIVNDVLSSEINPEIVATINSLGGAAKGFAGTDIFKCKKNVSKYMG